MCHGQFIFHVFVYLAPSVFPFNLLNKFLKSKSLKTRFGLLNGSQNWMSLGMYHKIFSGDDLVN